MTAMCIHIIFKNLILYLKRKTVNDEISRRTRCHVYLLFTCKIIQYAIHTCDIACARVRMLIIFFYA